MNSIQQIIDNYGLQKLNSATKYPSILTYHNLADKGSLAETLSEGKDFSDYENCYITEKIDGTNTRIIFSKHDYIIGSREELLYSRNDRIINPQMNIVNTVKNIAETLCESCANDFVTVLYGEVYGGNVTKASKQYTISKTFGFRMFDVAQISMSVFQDSIAEISSWRENGGQNFYNVNDIEQVALKLEIDTVPNIKVVSGADFPITRINTYKFLTEFSYTRAGIDDNGKSEGIVVRSFDRSLIRKIRFEDYERTMKREKWAL